MISFTEARLIANYVAEETRRQGDGPLDVGYMLNAWYDALERKERGGILSLYMITDWAGMIDPEQNSGYSFRQGPVFIGYKRISEVGLDRAMELWLENVQANYYDGPLYAYKAFEELHPFYDGNGRTGKIILNWLNETLRAPIFPPNDLFGKRIENP